jgi:hypothetical protein
VKSYVTRPLGVLVAALIGSAAGSAARQAVSAQRHADTDQSDIVVAAPLSIVLLATIAGLAVRRRGWLVALVGGAIAGSLVGEDADRLVKGAVGKAASMRARSDPEGVSGSIVT